MLQQELRRNRQRAAGRTSGGRGCSLALLPPRVLHRLHRLPFATTSYRAIGGGPVSCDAAIRSWRRSWLTLTTTCLRTRGKTPTTAAVHAATMQRQRCPREVPSSRGEAEPEGVHGRTKGMKRLATGRGIVRRSSGDCPHRLQLKARVECALYACNLPADANRPEFRTWSLYSTATRRAAICRSSSSASCASRPSSSARPRVPRSTTTC